MTLFSYEIFDAVARQGSFNKAAQQLHLTPSAISHAIAVMEEELGFALFTRGKSGVTMTSYGASLYPAIRAVLNSDEALQQSIARLNGLEKGKVRLGTFSSVCTHLLPGILQSFKVQYPQIEVEVYQGTYDDVKEWLRSGQVDIGFLASSCQEEFTLTELLREPLLALLPADWPAPPGRRDDPRHDEPEKFRGPGGRHRRGYAPLFEKVQDRRPAVLPCHRRHGQHLDGGSRCRDVHPAPADHQGLHR